MKNSPQSQALLAALLVASLVSVASGFAQSGQSQKSLTRGSPRAPITHVECVAESSSPDPRVAAEGETARVESPDKYILHVSDRAQRGRVQPSKLRAPGVLPELAASVPEEPRDPLRLRPNEPASES